MGKLFLGQVLCENNNIYFQKLNKNILTCGALKIPLRTHNKHAGIDSNGDAVDAIDVCDAINGCVALDGTLPSGYRFGGTAQLSGGGETVLLVDATLATTNRTTRATRYIVRATSVGSAWRDDASMAVARFEGSLASDSSDGSVYYSGGRATQDDGATLLESIERVQLERGNASVALLAATLSVARARSGSAVWRAANGTRWLVVVGGWLWQANSSSMAVASNVVDMIALTTSASRRVTLLSRAVVAPSVAALGNAIVVTGGALSTTTTIANAFDYGATVNCAVERYDGATGEWSYLANALTLFSDMTKPTQVRVIMYCGFVTVN